jgi:hypothetical protein
MTGAPVQCYPLGYPLQAAFQSSESSWSIYRSFDYLHARIILELQDQIRELEQRLKDDEDCDLENEDQHLLRNRQDEGSERAGLLEMIRVKLVQYGKQSI